MTTARAKRAVWTVPGAAAGPLEDVAAKMASHVASRFRAFAEWSFKGGKLET